MTSWIIPIAGTHPQHWQIAREHGFWDMTKGHRVHLGDTVYFWQSGGSLLAQCTATSSYHPIDTSMASPWEDSGEREYVARFTFDCRSDRPTAQPRWAELQQQWGKALPPQVHSFSEPSDEAVLAAYFDTARVTDPYRDEDREAELERLGYDMRTYNYRAIAQRQGQPRFRNDLLKAYGGRCAVTGTQVEYVLEAAHIASFRGAQSNKVYNGILLRADIHTLLDLHRLTITPDYVVRVDSALGEPYRAFEGVELAVPTDEALRPDRTVLAEHNKECDWYVP